MPNGLSSAGFKRKRLDEILADKNEAVKGVLGENLNLSPESPDGQINGVYSESDSILWELAEAVYDAFVPSKSTGTALSDLVTLNNLTREPAIASTVVLDGITGTDSTLIPAGSLVSATDGSVTVSTDTDVTISGGVASVLATATATGPIEINIATMAVIDTPITGWATVSNTAEGVTGQNEETDSELRARRERSISRTAITILDSIVAEVLAVPTTTHVSGFENDTDSVDANGLPPHSFLIVVEGGADEDIAKAISIKKTLGITSNGTTTVQVPDSQGVDRDISFSRPVDVPIFVRVDITTTAQFPLSGADDIKQAIVDYANGTLISGRSFGVSDDVIRTELFTPVNTVPEHSVNLLAINTTGSPGGGDLANITIGFDEKSEFTTANIEVNIL